MPKNPVEIIIVDSDGELLVASDRKIGGRSVAANRAREAATLGTLVRLHEPFGEEVYSGSETALALVAAMFAANPGRSYLLKAPSEVWDWLDSDYENNAEIHVSELTEEEVK